MDIDLGSKKREDFVRNSWEDSKLKNKVYDLIKRMSNKTGISIPNRYLPEVKVTKLNSNGYDNLINTIYISKKDLNSGVLLGEEIGHFLRSAGLRIAEDTKKGRLGKLLSQYKFKKGSNLLPNEKFNFKTNYTGEFFGYLGQILLKKVSNPKDNLDFTSDYKPYDLKKIIPTIRKIKGETRKLIEDYYKEKYPEGKTQQETEEYIMKLFSHRNDITAHQRPYYFASILDLDKIDLKELYELDDKEVRLRFFRKDAKYDLNKSSEGKVKRLSLEGKVISIIAIGIGLLFLSNNLTGNVISNLNKTNSNILGAVLFIIGLIGLLISNKKDNKD
ncbi:MAG: hypothetical protein WC438_04710 [Candidatus Pacearchaeota archaeon]